MIQLKSRCRNQFLAGVIAICLAAHCFGKGETITYTNHSNEAIWVERLLLDGREFPASCGILSPGKTASLLMFPRSLPTNFQIQYRMDYVNNSPLLKQEFSGREVAELMKKIPRRNPVTLHLIYSDRREFIAKLEDVDAGEAANLPRRLWPDESNPAFARYKQLVRQAKTGDAAGAKESLAAGVPYLWPNDPMNISPLEQAVLARQETVFNVLVDALPSDYPLHRFASCVRNGVQSGLLEPLRRMLPLPIAQRIRGFDLQEIFYTACDRQQNPAVLDLLLQHLKVGVNFRVRDYGQTLLFVAATSGNENLVRWLLDHGADKNARLENGQRAFDQARSPVIRQLLDPAK